MPQTIAPKNKFDVCATPSTLPPSGSVKRLEGVEEEKSRELHRVAAVVVRCEDRVLVLKRGPTAPWMPNKWNLPGGGVDAGETFLQGGLRELGEEAGPEVRALAEKNVVYLSTVVEKTYTLDVFAANIAEQPEIQLGAVMQEGQPVLKDDGQPLLENTKFKWVTCETLASMVKNDKFVPHAPDFVDEVLSFQERDPFMFLKGDVFD